MKILLVVASLLMGFSAYAQGYSASEGQYYYQQVLVQEQCSPCIDQFDNWGRYIGTYQQCKRARWRSDYGSYYGYYCGANGCMWQTQQRTWYWYEWEISPVMSCNY